jgi:hypothetical protein
MSYGFYDLNSNCKCIFIDYRKTDFNSFISHPLIFWKLEYLYNNNLHYINLITNLTRGPSHVIRNIGKFDHIKLIEDKLYCCNNPLQLLDNNVLINNLYIKDELKTQRLINMGYFSYINDLNNRSLLQNLICDNILKGKNNHYLLHSFINNVLTIQLKK